MNQRLNLNCEQAPSRIVQNRKAIYEECKERLRKIQQKGNWKESTLRQVLKQYKKGDSEKNKEYVGVPLYLLKKYMARCRAEHFCARKTL